MSLINEALKRAQEDAPQKPPCVPPPAPLTPAVPSNRMRSMLIGRLLSMSIMLAAGAGLWHLWRAGYFDPLPQISAARQSVRQTDSPDNSQSPNMPIRDPDDAQILPIVAEAPAELDKHDDAPPRTKPPQPSAIPDAQPPREQSPEPKLTGIIWGDDGPTAIIDGAFLHVGDSVGDAKIVAIGRQSADLERDGKRFTIRF